MSPLLLTAGPAQPDPIPRTDYASPLERSEMIRDYMSQLNVLGEESSSFLVSQMTLSVPGYPDIVTSIAQDIVNAYNDIRDKFVMPYPELVARMAAVPKLLDALRSRKSLNAAQRAARRAQEDAEPERPRLLAPDHIVELVERIFAIVPHINALGGMEVVTSFMERMLESIDPDLVLGKILDVSEPGKLAMFLTTYGRSVKVPTPEQIVQALAGETVTGVIKEELIPLTEQDIQNALAVVQEYEEKFLPTVMDNLVGDILLLSEQLSRVYGVGVLGKFIAEVFMQIDPSLNGASQGVGLNRRTLVPFLMRLPDDGANRVVAVITAYQETYDLPIEE